MYLVKCCFKFILLLTQGISASSLTPGLYAFIILTVFPFSYSTHLEQTNVQHCILIGILNYIVGWPCIALTIDGGSHIVIKLNSMNVPFCHIIQHDILLISFSSLSMHH